MRAYAIVLLATLAAGCQELGDAPNPPPIADEVYTEWDSSVDFTVFESFAFLEGGEDAPEAVSLNVTRVRNGIRKEYEALGLVESPVGEPADLDVMILTHTEDASMLELDCVPTVYWYGYSAGYDSCAFIELSKAEVTVGTIFIGIGDASRQETVFNSAMQGVANGQDSDARISRGVAEVFDQYPADQIGT